MLSMPGTKDSNTDVNNSNGLLFRITTDDDTDNYNSVIYGIRGHDGCLLIPQAISPWLQEQLAYTTERRIPYRCHV
jgi:hypothetical protein